MKNLFSTFKSIKRKPHALVLGRFACVFEQTAVNEKKARYHTLTWFIFINQFVLSIYTFVYSF